MRIFPRALAFSRGRLLIPLVIVAGMALITFLGTKLFMKKRETNTMGMKMDMSKPDMGLSMDFAAAPKAVAEETVKRQSLAQTVTYTGIIAPYLEEIVYPRVTGWLSKMPLYPGDYVTRGQEIAALDWGELTGEDVETHPGIKTGPYNVEVSEAQLRASLAREKEALDELQKAQANLAYWKNEFPRETQLLKEGAISKEEYDKENAEYKSAFSEAQAQENAHEAASQEREIAEYGLSAVRHYRIVRAHISGVVTDRMVNEGVLVKPGMGILKIDDLRQVRVQAFVAENDLAEIRVGTPVVIRAFKLTAMPIHAHVTSIFHEVDPEARTGKVEALIDNPKGKLFPGDYCGIDFILSEKKSVLSVPKRALTAFQGKTIVWVDEGGLAKRREVEPGISDGLQTEIQNGLMLGDKVIIAGRQDLVPDQPVVEGTWGSGNYREILFPEKAAQNEAPAETRKNTREKGMQNMQMREP